MEANAIGFPEAARRLGIESLAGVVRIPPRLRGVPSCLPSRPTQLAYLPHPTDNYFLIGGDGASVLHIPDSHWVDCWLHDPLGALVTAGRHPPSKVTTTRSLTQGTGKHATPSDYS